MPVKGIGKKIGVLALLVMILLPVALAALQQPGETEETVPQTTEPIQTVPVPTQTEPAETQPAETVLPTVPQLHFDQVPHYFQTDYPYVKFGSDTMATSGCSMTCLAMVASYLTDHAYMPDELAYHFENSGKNNVERIDNGSTLLGLPHEKVFDWRLVRQGLEEGKVAIVMVGERSRFTTGQHFIVATGLNERGKVMVNDPAGYNYANEYLSEGFENGFEDYDLTNGFSGAWIYDKQAVPENMELLDTSLPRKPETRYVGYPLPEEDVYTLASFAWAEARDQSEEVQQAILETILNRMMTPDYPDTVDKVIRYTELRRNTNAMSRAEPGYDSYRAVTAAVYGPYVLPMDVLHYSRETGNPQAWGQLGSYSFFYDTD